MSRVAALNALHEILNRRNVEWWEDHDDGEVFTYWKSPIFGIVSAIENEDGETLFMACLNNCDFTPEQAIVVTLDSGELTAEQMREAIRKYAEDDSCYIFEVYGENCGLIADELNAMLGDGECEPE